jgi:hypothetical protein
VDIEGDERYNRIIYSSENCPDVSSEKYLAIF